MEISLGVGLGALSLGWDTELSLAWGREGAVSGRGHETGDESPAV